MMHLITGGSGSGKSSYAESQVMAAGRGKRIYIATMKPWGKEGEQRVARHRKMREKKQFETVECYTGLGDVILAPDSIVLLECMSNLVANEIFEPEGAHDLAAEAVVSGVFRLKKQARELFVVTNEVFSDGIVYDRETEHYISVLGEVNRRLARMADRVTEVVYGIPVSIKHR